jgi:predicted RNase H-like HicB family nuclease
MAKLKSVKKAVEPLEYQVNVVFDPRDSIYVARVPELENCHTHGNTPEEAFTNAREAIELWTEAARENGIEIPPPVAKRKFSGKFVVRTPEKIHSELAQEAVKQGRSMNDLAVEYISDGLKRTG